MIEAVHLLAAHAWKLLPLYRFDPTSGLWRHREWTPQGKTSLHASLDEPPSRFPVAGEEVLAEQLTAARAIVRAVEADPPTDPVDDVFVSEDFERIRWFPLPGEAVARLRAGDPRGRRTSHRSPSSINPHPRGAHVHVHR